MYLACLNMRCVYLLTAGLKYHEELQLRMPRHEATQLITTVQAAVEKLAPGTLPLS
jgi:hypothetical protein